MRPRLPQATISSRLGGGPTLEQAVVPAVDQEAGRPVVSSQYTKRDYWLRRILALADVLALSLALGIAVVISGTRDDPQVALLTGLLTLPGWLLIMRGYGVYDRQMRRVSHTVIDDFPALFHGVVMGTALTWLVFKLLPVEQLVLHEVLAFTGLGMGFLLLLRVAAVRAYGRILGPERVLMVGTGPTANLLARKMRMHPEYNLEPVGAVTAGDGGPREDDLLNVPRDALTGALRVLGPLESHSFETLVARHRVERVVLSHTELPESAMVELMWHAKQLGVKVSVLPVLFDALGPSVEVDTVEGITVLGVNPPVLPRASRLLKRSLDLAGASVGLFLLFPLLLLIAAGIKLDSRGPVLFRQTRVGRRGRRFKVFKFRTMASDAEERRAELMALSADPDWLLIEDDPRITRVGKFLRLTSLDEFPQLWNVVRGEMSLVGPRPLIESEDARVDGWARTRLDLTPGITGLWQVLGRTSIPFEEMVKLDYLYVTNWSLWEDLRLMIKTVAAVCFRRGAN